MRQNPVPTTRQQLVEQRQPVPGHPCAGRGILPAQRPRRLERRPGGLPLITAAGSAERYAVCARRTPRARFTAVGRAPASARRHRPRRSRARRRARLRTPRRYPATAPLARPACGSPPPARERPCTPARLPRPATVSGRGGPAPALRRLAVPADRRYLQWPVALAELRVLISHPPSLPRSRRTIEGVHPIRGPVPCRAHRGTMAANLPPRPRTGTVKERR